jgi:SPW repeat
MRWQDWVNWVLGLWLFVSPAVLQFATIEHAWNAYLVATGIALITAAALAGFKPWLEWIALALGGWLVASPWLVGFSTSTAATWNAVVIGGLVVLFAAWALARGRNARRHA